MAEYQNFKIPIFTGINDTPKLPTAQQGGNISHFYDEYNKLVDLLETDVSAIQTKILKIAINEINIADNSTTINGVANQVLNIQNSVDLLNNAFLSDRINELNTRVDNLTTVVNILVKKVYPDPNLFISENVVTSDDGNGSFTYTISIVKQGTLKYIYLENSVDSSNITFRKNSFFFGRALEPSSDLDGYPYKYTMNIYANSVYIGDTVTIKSGGVEDNLGKVAFFIADP